MNLAARSYQADTFDDDCTKGFKGGSTFAYSKNSLIIIMRNKVTTTVNPSLAATVRDWL